MSINNQTNTSYLRIDDIISLNKTRDKDLETLNARDNAKNIKRVFNKTDGINLKEYKKAKMYKADLQSKITLKYIFTTVY